MSEPSPILTYDNLPSFSTLRREFDGKNTILTAPAEEPGPHVRRGAARKELLSSAIVSIAILLPLTVVNWMLMPQARPLALPYAIFGGALFLFIWHRRYLSRMEMLEKLYQQITTIGVRVDRVVIESSGPVGVLSADILAEQIRAISIAPFRFDRGEGRLATVECIVIARRDGGSIQVMHGRASDELRYVVGVLSRVIGIG